MPLRFRQLDPRTRRLIAFGNLFLVTGLLLWSFAHPSSQIEKNWLHGMSGLLLGLSISINLFAFRTAQRCREKSV